MKWEGGTGGECVWSMSEGMFSVGGQSVGPWMSKPPGQMSGGGSRGEWGRPSQSGRS